MIDEQIALGRRAIACMGWKWMRGMTSMEGGTFVAYTDNDEAFWLMHPDDGCDAEPVAWRLPNLTDPATLGCLLALVREAWGQDDMGASRYHGRWCIEFTPQEAQNYAFYGASEAEALVAALECAP